MGQEVKEQSYRLVGRLREVAKPEKPQERLSLVLVSGRPQTGLFLFLTLGIVLVRPPSFAFLCPSAPLPAVFWFRSLIFFFFFLAYAQVSVAVFHCGLTLLCLPC